MFQISCFDVTFAIPNPGYEFSNDLPWNFSTNNSIYTYIIETKNGEPPPDTGIPPSFITFKCDLSLNKNIQYSVDLGRPTKVFFSNSCFNKIMNLKNKVPF